MSREELINTIVMITVFGLVFSTWCICVLLWLGQYLSRLKKVQKRLGIVKKEAVESRTLRLWREMQKDVESETAIKKPTFWDRMERLRHDAGWNTPIQGVILGVAGAASVAFAMTYYSGGSIQLGLGVSAAIVLVFVMYTQKRLSKRAALFERQLVDALGIAARALRAGHPLAGAFQLVAEETADPVGTIFSQISQEQSLGLDMKDSIRKVADNTQNAELKLFATAVAIQLGSGGNLAELMDSLASVIRERMRLNRRARVLTAQAQLSKRILIALPILLFVMLNIVSPEYVQVFYYTTAGRYMLIVTVAMVSFGSWAMSRLSVLRY